MKIVNNFQVPVKKDPERGDIFVGETSGDYYMVIGDNGELLNLRSLGIWSRTKVTLKPTPIKKENITITFEGAN